MPTADNDRAHDFTCVRTHPGKSWPVACRSDGAVFPDPWLVAAIVDRINFNAHMLETGTDRANCDGDVEALTSASCGMRG